MIKKIELEIESKILVDAITYAKLHGTTVENLAENFIKELVELNN